MLTCPILTKRQISIILAFLSGISLAAALTAIVFPRWPHAEPLTNSDFTSKSNLAGFVIKRQTDLEGKSSFDIATSSIKKIILSSNDVVYIFNVHVRDRLNFSNQFISKEVDSVRLTSAEDADLPFPAVQGLLDDRPVYQACLVGDSAYGITLSQLTTLIDQHYPESTFSSLQRWFTFQPSRSYKCTHVSLQSSSTNPMPKSTVISFFNVLARK